MALIFDKGCFFPPPWKCENLNVCQAARGVWIPRSAFKNSFSHGHWSAPDVLIGCTWMLGFTRAELLYWHSSRSHRWPSLLITHHEMRRLGEHVIRHNIYDIYYQWIKNPLIHHWLVSCICVRWVFPPQTVFCRLQEQCGAYCVSLRTTSPLSHPPTVSPTVFVLIFLLANSFSLKSHWIMVNKVRKASLKFLLQTSVNIFVIPHWGNTINPTRQNDANNFRRVQLFRTRGV